jgi:hypothetical protein
MLAGLWFRSTELWGLCLLLLVVVGMAMAVLYPPQVKAVSRRWQWLLPVLRGAALAALAASVLRPVVTRIKTVREQGAVVVLMDRSLSMSATDRVLAENAAERGPVLSQMVALADLLGKLPEGIRSKAVAGVSDEVRKLESLAEDIVRARSELDYASLSGRGPQETQRRLDQAVEDFLAAAKTAEQTAKSIGSRKAVVDRLTELGRTPRNREEWIGRLRVAVGDARREIERSQAVVDEELYQSNPQVRWVCDDLSRMSRFDLSWEALTGGKGLLSRLEPKTPVVGFAIGQQVSPMALRAGGEASLRPDEAGSDMMGSLRRAMQRLGREPVQAVILFSDGQQVGPQAAIPSGLLPAGTPVFGMYTASPRVRDLAIERVEMPRTVFVGETLTVRVMVRNLRMEVGALKGEARLWADGGPMVTQSLRVNAVKKTVEPVEMKIRLDRPGIQRLVIILPTQDGEASVANNQAEQWVKVLSQRMKVLVLGGSGAWDYRYLCDALGQSASVELLNAVVAAGHPSPAISPERILDQDLVILHDVAREALTLEQWDAVGQLVSRRGGSVIVVPGLSLGYERFADHVMRDLLPYDPSAVWPMWRTWPGETPQYRAAVAPGAETVEALRLDDGPDLGWDRLPGFYRYLVIPELKSNTKVLLVERGLDAPLLTESRLGRGRVFFLGMSETWRWRYKVGGQDQDRFWLQLVRYAVDEPYALSNGPLAVDVDSVMVEPGQSFQVRARMATARGDVAPPGHLNLSIMREGQLVRTGVLEADADGLEGRYEGSIGDLPPDEYELHVAAPFGADAENEVMLPIRVRFNPLAEMTNLAGDRDALQQRLMEISGGKCLNLEQIGLLPQLLAEARRRQSGVSELELWDSGYLFVFVLGCLAAEWAMRKRFGLA